MGADGARKRKIAVVAALASVALLTNGLLAAEPRFGGVLRDLLLRQVVIKIMRIH